jgi:uncharacterized protein (TIRG00374 family)
MSRPRARRRDSLGDERAHAPMAPDRNGREDEAAPPRLEFTRRNVLLLAGFLVASIAALYYLLPQLAGLEDTWERIENGSPYWIFFALILTIGMFAGYVLLFRGVFVRAEGGERIGWSASYQITLAGLAASRIFAAGGAGGLVLTAWAVRRSGMPRRRVSDTTLTFLILTYTPYALALIVCGLGLRLGLFTGPAPFGLTVVPAVLAVIVVALALAAALVPTDLQRRLAGWASRRGQLARIAQRAANAPASFSTGMREAFAHIRARDPAPLGAVMFWAFQILVLWAAFRAFGQSPTAAVLVQAFFCGMLGNLLPMPGGVGGVEGGMIASLAAFGVDGGLAVVAVLVYRAFTFWLPMIPGVIAYFQLRKTVEQWSTSLSYTK